jgi:tetratricopeptide (TPR) repeat protein
MEMRMKMPVRTLGLALLVPFLTAGCSQVQAKQAFKDGNKAYKEEDFKKAVVKYGSAVEKDPNFAEAWFYLGSAHNAMYRPGKTQPENVARLEDAISSYNKSLEVNPADTENRKKVKLNTLAALTSIYSEEPKRNYDTAFKYAEQLVAENPNDAKNLYAMANLYEKFEKVDEAEGMYKKIAESNPNDPKACGALAGFYNKPLWKDEAGTARSKFDDAVTILDRCAQLAPNDPSGYQKVATFYWDKAYRDPLITDEQKQQYAQKGMEAVDKALSMKPDYFDAVIYKGLLYRVMASVAKDPRQRAQYLDQAQTLQKQGLELRKAQQAAEAAAAAAGGAASPAPTSAQ